MCECGCGEFRPIGKFRAGRYWYAIEFYPGCENCATELLGLSVRRFAVGDEDTNWMLDGVPVIAFDAHGDWSRPMIDFAELRGGFKNYGEEGSEAEDAFHEFLSRGEMRFAHSRTLATYSRAASGEDANGQK